MQSFRLRHTGVLGVFGGLLVGGDGLVITMDSKESHDWMRSKPAKKNDESQSKNK